MLNTRYVLFEYEGQHCIAKRLPFTIQEKLNGYFYYDLAFEEDEYFPTMIMKEGKSYGFHYWGSLMTKTPLSEVEKNGTEYLSDWDIDEDGTEIQVPGESFVRDVHFIDMNFYHEESNNSFLATSTDFSSLLAVWEGIEPYPYQIEGETIDRKWAMPNKNTFEMKPVYELLKEEIQGGFVIDPFANKNRWGHITNDLNEKFDTNYHMDALEFLKIFPDESVDVVLFDPPYSARQIKEAYESVGLDTQGGTLTRASYWSNMKKEIARILRVGGKAISFGWNSGGMNNKDLFHINRIRLIPHGGAHNDTIVTVSVKK
ncbi:hypothetical protein [Bacillus sp. NPDC094106]|uniref:hypothetical protein n=1 Tax=Bacillus sp. NPDC094106 TaxID=3363949 RepID=UPI00381A327B